MCTPNITRAAAPVKGRAKYFCLGYIPLMRKTSHSKSAPAKPHILALCDETLDYLREHSHGRQGEIAAECGVSRGTLNRYLQHHMDVRSVYVLAKLYDWVERDRSA